MLLLPLLMFWVRQPMHFSSALLRCLVPTVVVLAVSVPLSSVTSKNMATAADRYMSQTSMSGDEGETNPNSGRPTGVGNATHGDLHSLIHNGIHLREGSKIPAITGRFVMLGRRWAFVPERPEASKPALRSDGYLDNPVESTETDSENSVEEAYTTFRLRDHSEVARNQVDESKAIVVVENLLLQRIVNAVRSDIHDDTWTITAEATEFFDENRFIVLTAQRANSRQ
ncbi:hypothetical protein CA13_67430 [Planctomycetes bacterium CA13]|uniref:Uncharacterized protein n=1 Tax=Novipirellula herctigrandis TaxID=2527986 RepID=A0A5C5YMV1_9BACT|nr:hypothetical protein CA13_67430 [Planctomycetes bacterium CA13]